MRGFSWKNFTIFVLAAVVVRLLLTMNMPIFAVTGSGVDDYWMVLRANSILAGKWMGGYYNATLIKGMSFPTFLAVLHGVGISYYTGVTLFYLFTLVVLVLALRPFIDRFDGKYGWVVCVLFALLAFHPILYTAGAATRVYRNSITPSQIILIISCLYAIYLRRNGSFRQLVPWVILESLAMIFFIHTREDSMWIYVLYAIVAVIIFFSVLLKALRDRRKTPKKDAKAAPKKDAKAAPKNGQKAAGSQKDTPTKRIVWTAVFLILPILAVFCMTTVIRTINKHLYGLPIVNELTEGSFASALQSLYEIRMEEEETDLVTVPYAKLEKAFEVSPTLRSIKPELDRYYQNEMALVDPEAPGEYIDGLFFWQLRFAASDAGYHETLPKADAFYAKITEEIQQAFRDGKLEKRSGLMFSSLMPPIKKNTIANSLESFKDALIFSTTGSFMAAVEWTETNEEQLADFQRLTYDRVVSGNEMTDGSAASQVKLAGYQSVVKRVNIVSRIYNVLKWPVLILGVLSYLCMSVICLLHHFRKDESRGGKVYQLWLFATGFLGAFLMQTFIVGYNAAVNVGPANISTFYLSGAYPCWYLFALLSFVGAAAGISMILKKTAGH